MFGQALPFWAGAGRDQPGLGVREALTADGSPAPTPYKRMRVQARQIYAFSHAALLGWTDGEAVARDAYAFIQRAGLRPDGATWVRRLDPSGARVVDDTVDLYDQAFVLFALAWYARLTGEQAPLDQARRTAEWIRTAMRGPVAGYLNTLPAEPGGGGGGAHRQQNPHMHLLEAALALLETTRTGGGGGGRHDAAYWEGWAHELVGLFRDRFLDRLTGTLGEFFQDDWTLAPGAAGDHVEPGHHYEWVWLLHQYARLAPAASGDGDGTGADAMADGDQLYRFAEAHGCDPAGTGLVWDVVGRDGTVVHARSTRLWPQTEALKAHCAVALRLGGDRAAVVEAKIVRVVDNLLHRFFADCPPGAWRDRFDAAGNPVADGIPTSSFYHVFMGYAQLDQLIRSSYQP